MAADFILAIEFLRTGFNVVVSLWAVWLFLGLFFFTRSLWLAYVQEWFRLFEPEWRMIELRIPRELQRNPRAMEQVFLSLHGIKNSPSNVKEHYWDGEVPLWFSCEIVSLGGELHFYMMVPKKHKNIVEAGFYAQYPDIEIIDVPPADDYIYRMPATYNDLKKGEYELFGNELRLAKNDAYPIRTYMGFELQVEERELDPISAILETISKISPREHVWVQILVQPTDDSWRKAGEKMIKGIKEKWAKDTIDLRKKLVKEGVVPKDEAMVYMQRTPGETEVVEAIERNIAKPGFRTLIRYLYIAPREVYSDGFARRGIFSAFNQYMSEELNQFKHNTKAWTRTQIWYWPHIFPGRRLKARRDRMYELYRSRRLRDENFAARVLKMRFFDWGFGAQKIGQIVLNTEELATLFHPPTKAVLTGPLIKRAEARKIGPPAGLPIYGSGEEEELPGLKK